MKHGYAMHNPKSSRCHCFAQWILVLFTISLSFGALAQNSAAACGSLANNYGPFDYRTDQDKLEIVEKYHFTPEVEALIRGSSSDYLGQDLSYTLRSFPNHPRALMSMMRYGRMHKTPQPPYAQYSVECYFLRALRFRPDDTVVRMMYASFLVTNGRTSEAARELEQVSKWAGDDPFTYYNMGLIYLDMKQYDKALTLAHKAMALGFKRTGLREKLIAAGKWKEPTESQEMSARPESTAVPPPK